MWPRFLALASFLIILILSAGCQPDVAPTFVEVDGVRKQVPAGEGTVRDALRAVEVTLQPLDRVEPDLYVGITPGTVVRVTRVDELFETEAVRVPFKRKTVTNEALPAGETKLVQLGVEGVDEILYRRVLEDGREVERSAVRRVTVTPAIDEIIAVGKKEELPAITLPGTIAYIDGGNAWIMRGTSSGRRPVTTAGNLDGRVFDLSPDGRRLLFTTTIGDGAAAPINQLWTVNTTIVGANPISVPLQGLLLGEWADDGRLIAYSTAERTAGPPGWRANNDLWLLSTQSMLDTSPRQTLSRTLVISPHASGLYGWWGTDYVESPGGRIFAFSRPDQLGTVGVDDSVTKVLTDFTPVNTRGDWAWTPPVGWSPDGGYLAATLRAVEQDPMDNQSFDLWVFRSDGSFSARVEAGVGMWSRPQYGPNGILYGQALLPFQSVDSRYVLKIRDRDGSNPRVVFPLAGEAGIEAPVQAAWAPSGDEFVFVYDGNLFVSDEGSLSPRQLTTDGQCSQPRWAGLPR